MVTTERRDHDDDDDDDWWSLLAQGPDVAKERQNNDNELCVTQCQ